MTNSKRIAGLALLLGVLRMFAAGAYQRGSSHPSTTIFMVLESLLLLSGWS